MDPTDLLREAERHRDVSELHAALTALRQYATWRQGGGSEPVAGDALARSLTRRLQRLLRQPDDDADHGPALLGDVLDELMAERGWKEGLRERVDG